jgi:TolB protein
VVNPDGTGLLQLSPPGLLTPDEDSGSVPADWSPNGSQVAFGAIWKLSTGRGAGSALFVVNADGTGLRRITPFGIGALSARWSPDGRLIAFGSKFRSGAQIWVVHPDGTGLRELTQPTTGDVSFAPVWSPDSTKLLFQSFHPEINGGQEDLWIVNDDGTGLFQLTNTPENENTPSWGSAPMG